MMLPKILVNALKRAFERDRLGTAWGAHYTIVASRLVLHEDLDVESEPSSQANIEKVIQYVEDYVDELYARQEA